MDPIIAVGVSRAEQKPAIGAEENQASLRRGQRARRAAFGPAKKAGVSQPGRTWLSGRGGDFAGLGIGGCRG
jgi:hypothetical protein